MTNDNDPNPPIHYTGAGTYTVWDEQTGAHRVDVDSATCDCENDGSDEPGNCKHLKFALQAGPSEPDYERRLFEEWAGVLASTQQAANEVRNAAAYMSGGAAETAATDAQPAEDDDSGADDDGDDDTAELVDAAPNDAQEQLIDELQRWFDKAANFNDFDPEIIDLSWAETPDGRVGVAVERQPFSGGYYDDGEWQDKDAFDEHRETAGDTVLSPRDAFQWYGEPDYTYFISVDDVEDFVGGED